MKTFVIVVALIAVAAAFLFSKRASAPGSQDALVIEQLRAAGSDLSKPHPLNFYLYVPSQEAAERISRAMTGQGFKVEVKTAALGPGWLALGSKELVPTRKSVESIRQFLSELAEKEGGEYDGWEAQVVK